MQYLEKYRYQAVNLSLAALEGVIFLLCVLPFPGDLLYDYGEMHARLVFEQGQYWRLITSIFLHAGVEHLGSNLLMQVMLGGPAERNLGHIRYFIVFMASGICGNLLSAAWDYRIGVFRYSVGASGAIFGVMGVVVVMVIMGRKQVKQGTSLMVRAGLALFYSVYSGFASPNTDNAAHIGGLITGLLLGALFLSRRDEIDLRDLR